MTDFPIPPEAVEAAMREIGFGGMSSRDSEDARAALTAAIPHLLPALRDHMAAGPVPENPYFVGEGHNDLHGAWAEGYRAARHACWAEGYAQGREDGGDRWRAMAERLGEALREISHVEFNSTEAMQDFAAAALRDLQAMKETGS